MYVYVGSSAVPTIFVIEVLQQSAHSEDAIVHSDIVAF